MSSGRLQNMFSRRLQDVLRDVFKTSWKTKNCYAEDLFKTPSRHVFKTSSRPANVFWFGALNVSETKLNDLFPVGQFKIPDYAYPFRIDRNQFGGGIIEKIFHQNSYQSKNYQLRKFI